MTMSWHVDDCIASHVDQDVLDEFGIIMIKEFGEMEITSGNIHDFLGMKIIINEDCWYKANIDLYNSNYRPINYGNDYGNSTCSS